MKKTLPVFFLLIIITFFSIQLFAQKNYQPATVINNNGDTLKGFINYQNWERNPLSVDFKQGPFSEKLITYTPMDIKSFQVENEIYFSTIVGVDKSPHKTAELTYSSAPLIDDDTVFLSIYIKGKANLYYLVDQSSKQHYFIEKDSSGIHELIYVKYLKQIQLKTNIQKNERYKGQLNYFFSDCPGIKKDIARVDFRAEELIDLFKKYNQCVDPDGESIQVMSKEKTKINLDFGFVAGLSLTNLKFTSNESYYDHLTDDDYTNSVRPVISLSLNMVLPRNRGKWSIYNELGYKSYGFQNTYEISKTENHHIKQTTSLAASYIKLTNLLRYQIPDKEVRTYFQLGISSSFPFAVKNELKTETTFYDNYRVAYRKAIDEFRNFEVGIVGGIGAEYKKFSTEFRYEIGSGMSEILTLKSRSHTFFLLLAYHL